MFFPPPLSMHVSSLERRHFYENCICPWTLNITKITQNHYQCNGWDRIKAKYHLSTDIQRTADLLSEPHLVCAATCAQIMFPIFCHQHDQTIFLLWSQFWFCCHWDNNPYLHLGTVRSIKFVQSALTSQMKGHLEVKRVLLPLLLTCLKGKPQPDKILLNKHHSVLERQQSSIQLQKPPTSTNSANWTNY